MNLESNVFIAAKMAVLNGVFRLGASPIHARLFATSTSLRDDMNYSDVVARAVDLPTIPKDKIYDIVLDLRLLEDCVRTSVIGAPTITCGPLSVDVRGMAIVLPDQEIPLLFFNLRAGAGAVLRIDFNVPSVLSEESVTA